jgi:kynurenine formamidase
MSRLAVALAFTALLACRDTAPPAQVPNGTWVDLSHDFSAETIYWPTARPFALEVVSAQQTPGGFYYAANNICAAEHGGTHLDSPVHFAEGRETTDRIPLERLIGEAAVVDVSKQAAGNRDYRLDVAALEAWEAAHGRIGEKTIVLVRTDWSKFWPDKERYLGTTKTGPDAVPDLHFPGIDSTAAAWLVARKVKAVGIDTPSIDYGQSTDFMTHRILYASSIPAFENVAALAQLPATGSLVVALPMKIKNGSGGPLRIVALIPEPT